MTCWMWHSWGPWMPIRAWEATLEEWRVCHDCGKFSKGDSWRIADREAVINLHAESIREPLEEEDIKKWRMH